VTEEELKRFEMNYEDALFHRLTSSMAVDSD